MAGAIVTVDIIPENKRFVFHKELSSMLTTVLWTCRLTTYFGTGDVATSSASAGVTSIAFWESTSMIIGISSMITFEKLWKCRKGYVIMTTCLLWLIALMLH